MSFLQVLERLGPEPYQRGHLDTTTEHLEEFARAGLRTLCLAVATIPPARYTEWSRGWAEASAAVENREEKVAAAAELLERDLRLVGATAIEDKLQDRVPETIAALLEADIHVWMLTGDKQETAINIAKSCRLHSDTAELLIINSSTAEEAGEEVN